jgi:hypothetical protein
MARERKGSLGADPLRSNTGVLISARRLDGVVRLTLDRVARSGNTWSAHTMVTQKDVDAAVFRAMSLADDEKIMLAEVVLAELLAAAPDD